MVKTILRIFSFLPVELSNNTKRIIFYMVRWHQWLAAVYYQ